MSSLSKIDVGTDVVVDVNLFVYKRGGYRRTGDRERAGATNTAPVVYGFRNWFRQAKENSR